MDSANRRISSATTANPFPASPARAASMVALRANRLVCSDISVIVSVIVGVTVCVWVSVIVSVNHL